MSSKLKHGFVLIIATVILTGCRDTPSGADVKWALEQQIPGIGLERESHIRVGRVAMTLLRKVARVAAGEADSDLKLLSHIRRVNVATYRVTHRPEGALTLPEGFERLLTQNGWETIIRQRDEDDHVWVLFREGDNGSIRNLYVVSLDSHELSVVDLEGRLDRMIAEALAEDPEGLDAIFGA